MRTLADIDRRCKAAAAAFDVRDRIAADLGGRAALSAMKAEVVDSVAVLGAMLKDLAAGYLKGEAIDLLCYATLANAQRRLLADLGLERRAKDVTPDLEQLIGAAT